MSEHIEKARKLLSTLDRYPNAYVVKEQTSIATRAQAYATLALVEELANKSAPTMPEQRESRCPSCDHIAGAHSSEGCHYEVRDISSHHRLGVCPCITTEEELGE